LRAQCGPRLDWRRCSRSPARCVSAQLRQYCWWVSASAWGEFSHFGEQFLSKLDPVTGKVTDYPIPVLKPDHPKGTLDLETDPDGNLWIGMMYQGGMARFDRKTEQFRIYPVPKE